MPKETGPEMIQRIAIQELAEKESRVKASRGNDKETCRRRRLPIMAPGVEPARNKLLA